MFAGKFVYESGFQILGWGGTYVSILFKTMKYSRQISLTRALYASRRVKFVGLSMRRKPSLWKVTSGRVADSSRPRSKAPYRRIFVYSFCLINICLSISADANEIKTLNVERTVSVFSENLSPIHRMISEKFSSNTRNFTENVWLVNVFATQQFRSFWWLIFPSILLTKSWKLYKFSQLNHLFQLLHLVHMYGHGFHELSCILMTPAKIRLLARVSLVLLSLRKNGDLRKILEGQQKVLWYFDKGLLMKHFRLSWGHL